MAHDGTYTNSPTLGVAGLVVGDSDTAVSFDPTSNQYVVQNDTIAAQAFSALTIGCIIKPANPTDANAPIFWGIDGPATGEIVLFLDTLGRPFFTASPFTPGSNFTCTGTALSANTIYRIIGTWDGTTAILYVNGVSVASASFSALMDTDALSFYAAADQNDLVGNLTFDGVLDECFFVANHGATPTEVATIDAAWTGSGDAADAVNALSPYIFWRLGESSGATAFDSAGSPTPPVNGNFRFTPPTENTVSNVAFDVPPLGNRLMRYYSTRPRGKAVWHLEDDTISFDQPYPTVFPEAAQHSDLWPVPPVSNWWGSNLVAVTAKTVYYGGHTYIVDQAEETLLAAFLTAQGYTPGDWLVPL